MKLYESFSDPVDVGDYHLASFFIQLIVIVASCLLVFKLVFFLDKDKHALESKDGFFASVINNIKNGDGEKKYLRKIPSLNSGGELVYTDKFIDFENGGLWVTDKQNFMLAGYLLGVCLANIILVFSAAGPIYKRIRAALGIITREMCPYFVFVLPFGIWGAILCIILFVVGIISMFLAPFNLVLHFILGIIQSIKLIRDRH